jgi:UDP-N-acetylmuramoyl-tripeptide--D-alanyl-D-alanine ligase
VHEVPESAREVLDKVTVVKVDDTLAAFQRLGNFWRHKMRARIVGITGTNGKTTSKEFSAALIGSKRNVQYSKGSFNNHWGVPMSLLSIDPSHEVAIIEMGMNHLHELTDLNRIVEPDIVVCTMVGRGHLEGVGSIEGVARAKSEIYEHAPTRAVRIFNLENQHTRRMYETFGRPFPPHQVMTFAGHEWSVANLHPGCTLSANGFPLPEVSFDVVEAMPDSLTIRGQIKGVTGEATVPVFGRHNVNNLMVAAACGLACGLSPEEVWQGLPRCQTVWGRNQWVKLECGARVLFDGYNANPESMKAAIENFAGLDAPKGGRKFAVLGEMLEMGQEAPAVHRELGEIVAKAGFDGVSFFGPSGALFQDGMAQEGVGKILMISGIYEQNLAPKTLPVLNDNDIVLIKGSRGMRLEKVLSDLKPVDFQTKK